MLLLLLSCCSCCWCRAINGFHHVLIAIRAARSHVCYTPRTCMYMYVCVCMCVYVCVYLVFKYRYVSVFCCLPVNGQGKHKLRQMRHDKKSKHGELRRSRANQNAIQTGGRQGAHCATHKLLICATVCSHFVI